MNSAAELRERFEAAQTLAREAGALISEVYAQDFSVAFKGANDPVTQADLRANRHIVDDLRKRFPQDGVVAEEDADQSDAARYADCWFVDPLDGTKEFIAKNGEFSVMIGFCHQGRPILGVVYQPAAERLYAGWIGHEAFVEEAGRRTPLRVSNAVEPSVLRLVVSRSHRSAEVDQLKASLGIASERASGSVGLKIGLLATDAADLYVHFSDRSGLWDACAPEAVLTAAGGRLTGCDGAPIDYRMGVKTAAGIFASNGAAHQAAAGPVLAIATASGLLHETSFAMKPGSR